VQKKGAKNRKSIGFWGGKDGGTWAKSLSKEKRARGGGGGVNKREKTTMFGIKRRGPTPCTTSKKGKGEEVLNIKREESFKIEGGENHITDGLWCQEKFSYLYGSRRGRQGGGVVSFGEEEQQ